MRKKKIHWLEIEVPKELYRLAKKVGKTYKIKPEVVLGIILTLEIHKLKAR